MRRYSPESELPWIRQRFADHFPERVLVPAGADDCGVVELGDHVLVLTADYVNARPHLLKYELGTERDIGRLAVAASLADLAGTGATPIGLLLSVTLPLSADSDQYRMIVDGAVDEAERWNVPITGGDSKLADCMTCNVAAVGVAPGLENLFISTRARPGDLLWVSGDLGDVNAALLLLEKNDFDESLREPIRSAIVDPKVPLQASAAVSRMALRCAGTDLSDGLVYNTRRLCKLSRVGCQFDFGQLPVSDFARRAGSELGVDPRLFALGVGGDFQFIVAVPGKSTDNLRDAGLVLVGEITDQEGMVELRQGGKLTELADLGHSDGRNWDFADEARQALRPFKA